jgi:hypothetical protein
VCGAGAIALGQLILLLTGVGGTGLLVGHLFGLAVSMVAAVILLSPPRASLSIKPTVVQRKYLEKHSSFWRFALPAGLLNIAAGKFPLFLIGAKYGLVSAGLFALTERVLTAPISLLAASLAVVRHCSSLPSPRIFVHGYSASRGVEQGILHEYCRCYISLILSPVHLATYFLSQASRRWSSCGRSRCSSPRSRCSFPRFH